MVVDLIWVEPFVTAAWGTGPATPLRRAGEELCVYDGRPNSEMVLATGAVEPDNPADHLTMQAGPPKTCAHQDRQLLLGWCLLEALGLLSIAGSNL